MSSTCANLPVACEAAQAGLAAAFNSAGAGDKNFIAPQEIALNQFLNTPTNGSKVLQSYLTPSNNKVREVKLIFSKRGSTDEVEDVSDYDCDATDEVGQCEASYTLDTTAMKRINFKMLLTDLTDHCQGDDYSYFWSFVASKITTMDRAVAQVIADKAATLSQGGAWGADVSGIQGVSVSSSVLNVRTRLAASGVDGLSPYPFMMEGIKSAIQVSGWQSAVIFSGNAIEQTARQLLQGCCTNSGADIPSIMAMYGMTVVPDQTVVASSALNGQTKALIFQPGALQLVDFHRFGRAATFGAGNDSIINMVSEGASYRKGYVMSPYTGNIYDFIIKDDCPGEWNVSLYWCGDLFGLPADAFPSGDRFEGVTYVNSLAQSNS